MLWLCLYFPLLPLQVFTRSTMDGSTTNRADTPTLISEQNRVCCANSVARSAGIKPGQSVTTAAALVPGLQVINRNADRETAALTRLADWCYQFSPMVSLKPPNLILLEIQGSLRLFKGLQHLREQLSSGLKERGFIAQQGLGDTPKAAELLARNRYSQIVADTQSPAYQQQLAQTPLVYLDIPNKQIQLLQEMGITTFGKLLALPRQAVGKRFGRALLHYLEQATGERADPQLPIRPKPNFHSELFYIEGIRDKEGLLFPIKRLLNELCDFLRIRQLYCQRFSWRFTEIRQPPVSLTLELSQAQNNLSAFLELSRIKLEALPLTASVHSITLYAKSFVEADPLTPSLLTLTRKPHQGPPELMLDKLSARLGKEALYGIATCAEHAPEQAWQRLPHSQLQNSQLQPPTETVLDSRNAPGKLRPFWLLPQPAPIRQRRGELYWRGSLTLLRGPERIDSHWWQPPHIQRDYFLARHEKGGLYWIFRDLTDRRWFLHGLFY